MYTCITFRSFFFSLKKLPFMNSATQYNTVAYFFFFCNQFLYSSRSREEILFLSGCVQGGFTNKCFVCRRRCCLLSFCASLYYEDISIYTRYLQQVVHRGESSKITCTSVTGHGARRHTRCGKSRSG